MKTENKESIYATAQNLFALHGFEGVSISEIAKRADVAKATVLHHYPTKRKLYEAVLRQSLDHFFSQDIEHTQTSKNLKKMLHWFIAEPIHAKLLNRVFMDNPRAANFAVKKYWLPLLTKLAGSEATQAYRARILFIVNSMFQMAFSIELQQLIADDLDKSKLVAEYENLIDELTAAVR